MAELRAVSDAWLAAKKAAEKRFSLGYFDERYLACFDCAVVRSAGAIVAFANIWRAGADTELSVDLMRYNDAAPKGVIDFLLIECMLWGKAQHYQWFGLGMAPLSGLEEHALAPAWHKLGRMVQRYGETFYPFEGLRKYKEKFLPVWRPRYLAAPGRPRHGGRAARRHLADFGRRQQGAERMIRSRRSAAALLMLAGCGGIGAARRCGGHPRRGASARRGVSAGNSVSSYARANPALWTIRRRQRLCEQRRAARCGAFRLGRRRLESRQWYRWRSCSPRKARSSPASMCATPRTPEGAAQDLDRSPAPLLTHVGKSHAILIGYSQGADTMPFMVNRLMGGLALSLPLWTGRWRCGLRTANRIRRQCHQDAGRPPLRRQLLADRRRDPQPIALAVMAPRRTIS